MTEQNRTANIREEVDRATQSFESARVLYQSGLFNDAVSRLYYTLFPWMKALLLSKGLEPKTHEGALTLFTQHFVKSGNFTSKDSHLFSRLMKYMEEADYSPAYYFTKNDFEEFEKEVLVLLSKIENHLRTVEYL